MRRIAILVAVLTVLLLGGLGLLVGRALESVASEQAMRHSVLADRVFDEIEEELTALIEREESRPFLQYRFFYVPEGQLPGSAPSLSRSPLSEVPEDDWLLGWFQVDPGGDISTPLEPRSFEFASTVGGWTADEGLSERATRVRLAAQELPFTPPPARARDLLATLEAPATVAPARKEQPAKLKPPPPPKPTATAAPVKEPLPADDGYVGVDALADQGLKQEKSKAPARASSTYDTTISSLNKGAESRSGRQQRWTKSRADNVGSFQNPEEYNNAYLQQGNALPEVGFENDGAAAVTDTVAEGPSLLGRVFGGEGRRADPEDDAAHDEDLDDEIVAAADQADEDLYAPQPERRGRFKNSRRNAAPVAQSAQVPALIDQEVPEAEEVEEQAEGEGLAGTTELVAVGGAFGAGDAQVALAIPAPAGGPASSVLRELGDERFTVRADKDQANELEPTPSPDPAPAPDPEPPRYRPKEQTVRTRTAEVAAASTPEPTPSFVLATGADEVDVEISPLRGHRADAETLLLYRTVRIGDTEYVQGLALLLPGLAAWLETRVLDGAEVRPFLDLVWNVDAAEQPGESDFVFAHTFADPFTSLGLTAYLSALPEGRRSGRTWILQLTVMLLLVGSLGIAALWRMVSVVVQFAERRNNFVSAVSHELKTPLTAIRMYSEMLRDGYVLTEEKRAEYYGTMAAESERLSRLIQNVLELSRLERNGAVSGNATVGQVRPVLEEALRVLERHARDRGFTIELDVPDDLPSVRFERDGLLQVLINLVDNAIKFSTGTDTKVVVVEAVPLGGGIALSIRDHGPGVPARQLKSIFEPFFRGERELTRRTKGTGIGLALVKGIVERMGGEVTARNHPGGGFEVRVALAAG